MTTAPARTAITLHTNNDVFDLFGADTEITLADVALAMQTAAITALAGVVEWEVTVDVEAHDSTGWTPADSAASEDEDGAYDYCADEDRLLAIAQDAARLAVERLAEQEG